MNIDLSAPALVQRNDHGALAATRGTSAHEEPGAADAAPNFAALLNALDPGAGSDPAGSAALGVDALAAVVAQVEPPVPDPALLLAQGLSRTPLAVPDPAAGPISSMGSDPADGGATAVALPGSDLPWQTEPPQGPLWAALPGAGASMPVLGAAGGMAGGTGSTGVAAGASAAAGVSAAAGASAPSSTAITAVSDAPRDGLAASSASPGAPLDGARPDGAAVPPTGDAIDRMNVAQRRTTRADGGGVARGDETGPANGEGARSDWRALLAAQSERVVGAPPTVSEAAAGVFRPMAGPRHADRGASRSGLLALDGAPPGVGALAGHVTSAGSTALGAALPDAVPAAAASAEVAQKVHYWITRGTQNAELQLDAFGGKAVDVSISVQGNEALVEFRTDQPDARRVLQEAMPQLREMLKSEGLSLAGGFVGTSAQQDPQAQSRRASAAAAGRTVSMSAPPTAASETAPRRAHGPGREVDVFV